MESRYVLFFGLLVFGIVGVYTAKIDEAVSGESLTLVPYPYSMDDVVSSDTTVQRLKRRDVPRPNNVDRYFTRSNNLQHPQPAALRQQHLPLNPPQGQPRQQQQNPPRRAPGRN